MIRIAGKYFEEIDAPKFVWSIRLGGGTAVKPFQWYLLLAGLIVLGLFASVLPGVAIGLIANNGDVGVLTSTFFFAASVVTAFVYVRRRITRYATIDLFTGVRIKTDKKVIVNWNFAEIHTVHWNFVGKGAGLSAALPSGTDILKVEHQNDSIVFQMDHDAATECVEAIKTRAKNAVFVGSLGDSHVPSDSDRVDQVWRSKLRSEFRDALRSIALGVLGCGLLGLFGYLIFTGQRPKGRLLISCYRATWPHSGAELAVYFFVVSVSTSFQSKGSAVNELIAELLILKTKFNEHRRLFGERRAWCRFLTCRQRVASAGKPTEQIKDLLHVICALSPSEMRLYLSVAKADWILWHDRVWGDQPTSG